MRRMNGATRSCDRSRVPHHITQRGNARRFILEGEVDRKAYLDLLRQSLELHE